MERNIVNKSAAISEDGGRTTMEQEAQGNSAGGKRKNAEDASDGANKRDRTDDYGVEGPRGFFAGLRTETRSGAEQRGGIGSTPDIAGGTTSGAGFGWGDLCDVCFSWLLSCPDSGVDVCMRVFSV